MKPHKSLPSPLQPGTGQRAGADPATWFLRFLIWTVGEAGEAVKLRVSRGDATAMDSALFTVVLRRTRLDGRPSASDTSAVEPEPESTSLA